MASRARVVNVSTVSRSLLSLFPPPAACSRVDGLVGLEELFNFRAPAFPEVRSALAANRDLIDGPSPVSVLSLPLLRPGVCCKIGL